MGRRIKGWWDEKRGRWLVRMGPTSERTGKRTAIPLCDARGEPIARDDATGRDAAIARLAADRMPAPSGPTVADVCRLYLDWHRAEGSSPRTIRTHWEQLGRFAGFVRDGLRYADRPAASIAPRDLAAIRRSGMGSLRHLYASVLACWRWAARPIEDREPDRLIAANPLEGMIRPKGGQLAARAMSWDLARRMLRMARGWASRPRKGHPRTRAMRWIKVQALVAMAYSGGRTAEIVTLEWGDIRWEDGVAAIPAARTKTRRTGRVRYVPLLPRLIEILRVIERWPDRHERWVFATRWHDRAPRLRKWWRAIRDEIRPYLAARGLVLPDGWRPYWLRHTVATQASRAVGREKAAKAMGHSPQVLDSTYDHVEADRVREVGDAVDRARKRRTP